jgi:hypothetical protein
VPAWKALNAASLQRKNNYLEPKFPKEIMQEAVAVGEDSLGGYEHQQTKISEPRRSFNVATSTMS